ncbi:MAG TPA: hypothetical protein VGA78_10270 [Gemmatimonadales bacterium]
MDSDAIKLFWVLTAIGLSGGVIYTVIAIVNVVTRKLEGRTSLGLEPDDVEYLRERAEQVEVLEQRMAELETRVDFAERLLTAPRDPAGASPERDQAG